MLQESLIVSTFLRVFVFLREKISNSGLAHGFERLCRWVGTQWRESAIVGAFCRPVGPCWRQEAGIGPLRQKLCEGYERLGLKKLLTGSIFLQCFFWTALTAALTPLLPTMLTLGLVLVGYGSVLLQILQKKQRLLQPLPLALYLLVYVGLYALGVLTSVSVSDSLQPGLLSMAFALFTLVLYYAVESRRQLDLLVGLLVTAAAAVSFYGILQYLFGWGYQSAAWVDSDMFSSIQFRVGSTMQNPNMLGEYLILMIPLGGEKLLSAKGIWRRLFYFGCCAVMCICMILTFSRGAWLGLLCAGALFFLMLQPRLLVLLPVALAGLYVALPQTVVDRFTSIGNLADQSTSYRVSIWRGSLRMLADGYWLTGVGPGEAAFNAVYPRYALEGIVAPHAHNLYLQIVCDAGILALLAFLLLVLRYFRVLAAALRRTRSRESRLLQIACFSGVAGFLVQALTDYSFYNYRATLLFWIVLAVGALSARREHLSEGGLFS